MENVKKKINFNQHHCCTMVTTYSVTVYNQWDEMISFCVCVCDLWFFFLFVLCFDIFNHSSLSMTFDILCFVFFKKLFKNVIWFVENMDKWIINQNNLFVFKGSLCVCACVCFCLWLICWWKEEKKENKNYWNPLRNIHTHTHSTHR